MEEIQFYTRCNVMPVESIQSFAGIRGGYNKGCKDVYFIRCIGCNRTYLEEIQVMDKQLTEREQQGEGKYLRMKEFPKITESEGILFYKKAILDWKNGKEREIELKDNVLSHKLKAVLATAYKRVLEKYREYTKNCNESMETNFLVKLMFWTDNLIGKILLEWEDYKTNKFVFYGMVRKQEYLFCYLLTLLGIDVLILSPMDELKLEDELLHLSKVILHEKKMIVIPEYKIVQSSENMTNVTSIQSIVINGSNKVDIRRTRKKEVLKEKEQVMQQTNYIKDELEFEELAMFASSIVMIAVHNRKDEVIGTGSGIMIGKQGYILTNYHVINNGLYYSVRIENEENIYKTDELIKYNQVLDLALIRINRRLTPIPIYTGRKELVRGQKVVAIGSPLGLFNSVSNGIIAGFRTFDDVNMIQFTAPISPGSSGGAVINMHGEVIGISTSGLENGQNLNLAVNYQSILAFTCGFV